MSRSASLTRPRRRSWRLTATVNSATATNTLVGAWFLGPASALWWLSPGAQGGLVTGAALAALLAGTSPKLRLAAIVVLLTIATAVANLAPPSGYFDSMLGQWDQGPLLNFNGLVRATAVVWPFAAIAWAGARLREARRYTRRFS